MFLMIFFLSLGSANRIRDSLLSVIVRISIVLKRTRSSVDSDSRFDNLSGSHLQSHVNCGSRRQLMVCIRLIVAVIGQFSHDVIGC